VQENLQLMVDLNRATSGNGRRIVTELLERFSDEDDLRTLVDGVRIAMDIASQEAMDPYTETRYQTPASDSDEDVEAFVRRHTHSIFHASGTCAMGSVVDRELRVRGVDGLRVADVSVMPKVGRGAPNASAIMIGERAADIISGAVPLSAAA